ncbi:MAG: formylglycine-generating enzyme family protein [Nitrospinales bacterium]
MKSRYLRSSSPRWVFTLLFLLIAAVPAAGAPKPQEHMALIPAGPFMAGEIEAPKKMTLDTFYMDQYEVTQKKFQSLMGNNPSDMKGPDRPVESVTWFEAREYCNKLGKRLPTEWEWEKAARAGSTTKFFWGNRAMPGYTEFLGMWKEGHNPVGSFKPNAYGLYDMAGNVWEWTATDEDGKKVMRGGSWYNGAHNQRHANRITNPPGRRNADMGFRCAADRQP